MKSKKSRSKKSRDYDGSFSVAKVSPMLGCDKPIAALATVGVSLTGQQARDAAAMLRKAADALDDLQVRRFGTPSCRLPLIDLMVKRNPQRNGTFKVTLSRSKIA